MIYKINTVDEKFDMNYKYEPSRPIAEYFVHIFIELNPEKFQEKHNWCKLFVYHELRL